MPKVRYSFKPTWIEAIFALIVVVVLLSSVDFADVARPTPPPRVSAGTIDGKTIEGTLVGVSADGVEIATSQEADGGRVKLSAATLTSISVEKNAVEGKREPSLTVSLVDGSLLAADSFAAEDGVATLRWADGKTTKVSTKRIQAVRFRAPAGDDPFGSQWNETVAQTSTDSAARGASPAAAKAPTTGDVLVIRKKMALDYLEGVAGKVDDETVVFEVDHDPIKVKRTKIEGLIYYRSQKDELPAAVAVVTDRAGSRLEVATAALDGDTLKLTTPAGQELALPLAELDRLDYSSASTQLLSELEPESFEYVSFFGGKDPLPSLGEFYKPRRDASFDQLPLRLAGKTFAKGLSLHARTKVVYRLPGKFSRLSAVVGIDDSVRDAGDVRLAVRGDGKMLWEETVRGTDAPRLLDVSVAGVKRLEIVADFGGDFDAGDVIDLGDAKVTR